ncbi:hypothetical protein EDC19_0940 [Natranaerovirga hydrolytica]|uniref:Uncharacterized protein n=1 Tax=Natranaerovirga hydrolytica TaxID=680378 RepID=A0A4R1MYX4_9FIRM|nr:hypothetical protein [Natranaerovirga hydrolytica]TCK98518.1 hypothetical protein EDC19_0940 [Natranaerovirga hydrolytica]
MYKMLQRNLEGYFSVYKENEQNYRYEVAQALKGFMDKRIYDRWRTDNPKRYKEVNTLVYHIQQAASEFPRFETLSWDLWGMGYIAQPINVFSDEDLREILNIINLCLGTSYIQDNIA